MKKLVIKNEKDFKKFCYLIWFYKHLKTKFTLDNTYNIHQDELKKIIELLNIKDKQKRLDLIYDYICGLIDKEYILTNFCEFKNDQCLCQRIKHNPRINGCCQDCENLKNGNCSIKAITCKLYFCPFIKKRKKAFRYQDNLITKYFLNFKQKLIFKYTPFTDKKEMLRIVNEPFLKWVFSNW